MNQSTEEKQAFGLLVVKVISPEETYSYLLTAFPIALSDSSGELQQSQKVPFKNYLISESRSTRKEIPTDSDWINNGMAVVQSLSVKFTCKKLTDTFLQVVTPQKCLHQASIQIIMDTYDRQ